MKQQSMKPCEKLRKLKSNIESASSTFRLLICLAIVLSLSLQGCATKQSKHSIRYYSKVTSKCQPLLLEPDELEKKEAVILENTARYGDCAGKVLILMDEVQQLSK